MAESQSLVPVAAIVDLILGFVTIALVRRSSQKEWVEKFAGLLIGWILILKGLEYTFTSVMETIVANEGLWIIDSSNNLQDSFFRFAQRTCKTISILLLVFLPFIYPYPILQRKWNIKVVTASICVLSLILSTISILTNYRHSDGEWFMLIPGMMILVLVYIRFLLMEIETGENSHRRMSLVAGLLLIAMLGEQMTYWLAQIISINDDFLARFAVEWSLWDPSTFGWLGTNLVLSMGASTILILLVFESWRTYHMGISGFSTIVYLVAIVGFTAGIVDYAIMDIVRSCVETECESFPAAFEIWYDFTSETLVYLFTPLIFMYILLNFDIIDSDASENRWLTRIMVILMLLIVSSSVIELLQSFLPVPEMISSAALAMVVAIFIGWEERIMTNLMREGDTVSQKLMEMEELILLKIDERDYDIMSASMASVVFFSLIICALYSAVI